MSGRTASLAFAMIVAASCGSEDDPTYQLRILVDAPGAADGREVRFTARGESAGAWQGLPFTRTFCTIDREQFVSTPIRVEVREGDVVLADVEVERFACALDPAEGNSEIVGLFLDPDGTLHSQLGSDAATYTGCAIGATRVCATAELR